MAEEKKELFIKKYAYENPNVVMVKGEGTVEEIFVALTNEIDARMKKVKNCLMQVS